MTPTECGLSKNDRKGLRKRPFSDGEHEQRRGTKARDKSEGTKNEEPERKKTKQTQRKENLIVYPWMLETRSSNKCKSTFQIFIFFFKCRNLLLETGTPSGQPSARFLSNGLVSEPS